MRLRREVLVPAFFVVGGLPGGLVARDHPDVERFLAEQKGKAFWTKVDVIQIREGIFGAGRDATNILADGSVSHRLLVTGVRSTVSTSVDEFTKEVHRIALQEKREMSVRVWNRGTRVTIHDYDVGGDEVRVNITEAQKAKSSIRLRFNNDRYDFDDFKKLFTAALAENESELKGAASTVALDLGMSVDKVISLKGKPKTQVNLGRKTILTYDDMKLVFEDDKLIDVQ